jgi:hypothetical protein
MFCALVRFLLAIAQGSLAAAAASAVLGCRSAGAAHGLDGSSDADPTAEIDPMPQVPVEAGAQRTIAALAFETPIYNRRELPPRNPNAVDEKSLPVRLGSLRKGQRIAVKPSVVKTGQCPEGWYELFDGGFICGRFATEDLESKELKVFPHTPYDDRPLPYDYGLNLTNGTPMYRRAPLRRERAMYEKGLISAGKSEDDRIAAAKELAAEKGEAPWYLKEKIDKSGVTLDDLKGESALVVQRMVRGFYLALDEQVHAFAGKFWRTVHGDFVPAEHVLVHRSTTEFDGVWFRKEGEERKLPLAFVLRPGGARQYRFVDSNEAPKRSEDKVPRFTIVGLTGNQMLHETRKYFETTEGWYMRDLDGTVARSTPAPPELQSNEKWIDVNLTTETLVAYEGTEPVFATLVSSGRRDRDNAAKDHPTPMGSFRIREKHIATTMDDDTATDGPYSIEEVPWVMYFERSYALHGAFWHSQFGHEHSHGCVNMTPHDARDLFAWVGPILPAGWHAVRATATNPGTRVIVHE